MVRFEHVVAGFVERHTVTAVFFGVDFGILAAAFEFFRRTRVHNLDTRQVELFALSDNLDAFGVAKQNRMSNAFNLRLHGGLEHIEVAFGKHNALGVTASGIAELTDKLVVVTHHVTQTVVVGIPIGNRLAGHATFDSGLGHSDGHIGQQTRIERLRNQVFLTEGKALRVVSNVHHIRNRLVGKGCNSAHGSVLHVFVDAGGANVEGSTENVGETDNVVHLVRIVAAARRKNQVATACHGFFVADFGVRVGECENDRLVGHATDHFASQDISLGEADEHICTLHGIFKRFDVGAVGRKESLRFG